MSQHRDPLPTLVWNYDDLLAGIRAEKARLGLTHDEIDERCGWCDRYSSKVLGPNGPNNLRRLGKLTFPEILQALDLCLVLIRAPKSKTASDDIAVLQPLPVNPQSKTNGGRSNVLQLAR